ncbi:MAG: bifunctional glutamate N-acetyltransferase/amino-acid acetyltransferase ArgJ [Planctomycetes bacterium]|nr:bifunctional glutamate N-acetyltransferase/amino-acid acetyltransferase ArgJ [Planctomycetota bacterium]
MSRVKTNSTHGEGADAKQREAGTTQRGSVLHEPKLAPPHAAPPWPLGVRAAGVSAGIKSTGAPDLAMLRMDEGAAAAAVFTTNIFAAAPILVSRQHLRDSRGHASVLIINSGCANAATGEQGLADADSIGDCTARVCDCSPDAVLMNSTGIIGKPLPRLRIEEAIPALAASCAAGSAEPFARAIMTTDTRPKMSSREVMAADGGAPIRVTGVAKGAGMIHPNMATMIAVIATDAALEPQELDAMLRASVEQSFHRISIDGDTSTNDSVFAFATGKRHAAADRGELQQAFVEVAQALAQMVVCDGEGFTRGIRVTVRGAASAADALAVARTAATSTLVRCAVTGGDPNWGRLLAAAGRSGATIDPLKLTLRAGGVLLFEKGCPVDASPGLAAGEFSRPTVDIEFDLGLGSHSDFFLSSGMTEEYVKLNSEYTT